MTRAAGTSRLWGPAASEAHAWCLRAGFGSGLTPLARGTWWLVGSVKPRVMWWGRPCQESGSGSWVILRPPDPLEPLAAWSSRSPAPWGDDCPHGAWPGLSLLTALQGGGPLKDCKRHGQAGREQSVFPTSASPLLRNVCPEQGLEQVVEVVQALAQLPDGQPDAQLPGQLQPHLHGLQTGKCQPPRPQRSPGGPCTPKQAQVRAPCPQREGPPCPPQAAHEPSESGRR